MEQTYWEFDPRAIEKDFVTLGCICNEVIRCGGDNTYKLPHIGKDSIVKETGSLPLEIRASEDVLKLAREWGGGNELEVAAPNELPVDLLDETGIGIPGMQAV